MAEALADADADHLNWIAAVAGWVFLFQADHGAAVRSCRALLDDPDLRLRPGAGLLFELLADISPPLQPADVGRSPLAQGLVEARQDSARVRLRFEVVAHPRNGLRVRRCSRRGRPAPRP
jgi:hypothetical protein